MQKLFSYGTLQQDNVQLQTFGRRLDGQIDTLPGYIIGDVTITDEYVIKTSGSNIHPILRHTGKSTDEVPGTVFNMTDEELIQADEYEVAEYTRIQATLKSGKKAWIYAATDEQ